MKKSEAIEFAEALKEIIYRNISLKSTRSGKFDNVVHVSGMLESCPRRVHLASILGINLNRPQPLPKEMKVTFKIGCKIEDIIVEALSKFLHGRVRKVENVILYEPEMLSIDAGRFTVKGHPDIIVDIDGKKSILEVKSIDGDTFKTLDNPLLKHCYQINSYLHMSKKLKKGYNKYGFIIYMSKAHTKNPIKIFPSYPNKDFVKWFDEFVSNLSQDKLPPRPCKTKSYIRAWNCPVVNKCFGGKSEE